MGGTFTKVGPGVRGAAGLVDVTGSTFGSAFPDVVGAVYAAASDGAGGWYLAGDFSSVGGQARSNLAQVDSTGAVTAWAPVANAPVRTLVVGPDGVYVGGDFTTLAGGSAGGVGKLDASGALLWGATASGGVVRALTLSTDGSTLYVGGAFTALAGVSTLKRLGALSAAAGTAIAGFAPGTVNQAVYALSPSAAPSGSVATSPWSTAPRASTWPR